MLGGWTLSILMIKTCSRKKKTESHLQHTVAHADAGGGRTGAALHAADPRIWVPGGAAQVQTQHAIRIAAHVACAQRPLCGICISWHFVRVIDDTGLCLVYRSGRCHLRNPLKSLWDPLQLRMNDMLFRWEIKDNILHLAGQTISDTSTAIQSSWRMYNVMLICIVQIYVFRKDSENQQLNCNVVKFVNE